MEIPAPKFEIFETVEPTQDAAIKHGGPGKVEHRAWVEYDQRPGYWRYTVRWPAQGTSSESDEHLQVADRLMCDLRVVVSGAPFKFESWTTESVDVLIERALEKAGVVIRPDEWTLRSSKGVELKHLVGDAELFDGETLLYLDPQVGGGGDEEPTAAEEAGQVWPEGSPERRLIERGGKEAVLRDIAAADEAREADAQEAINAVGDALDRIDAPQGATYAERIDRLYRELRGEITATRLTVDKLRAEGKVKPGTRELVIVLEDVSDADQPPEYRFIELEDQDGAGVGGFPMRPSTRTPFLEISIPYGRDDGWVSEVAYQVAGAATRPLLEDHPDYVFPAERVRDAVAYLLETFGVPRACHGCQEEQLEHGRAETMDAPGEDRGDDAPTQSDTVPDEFSCATVACERLMDRLEEGPVPNAAELARVIDILRNGNGAAYRLSPAMAEALGGIEDRLSEIRDGVRD